MNTYIISGSLCKYEIKADGFDIKNNYVIFYIYNATDIDEIKENIAIIADFISISKRGTLV